MGGHLPVGRIKAYNPIEMPILDPYSIEFISRSTEQTRRLGMRLGALLKSGDLVCLEGDLGSGKTTLVQGVVTGWGSLDHASSPTFVLVNVYRHPEGGCLYHLDAYRLKDAREAEELDLDTMLEDGPVVIEWAERIQEALPDENLWVKFSYISDDQRDLIFKALGDSYRPLFNSLRRHVYGIQ
jgi:tRNA threonylcarbamoyladenosine biosynthesis protein TsaE